MAGSDRIPPYRFSVAPMMDWTDRHCRFFHRRMSRRALLYTEMISARALVHGDCDNLLLHHPEEHPLALQLGGSDPGELALAAVKAEAKGYREINLNVGCPSDRVQGGCFGAILMKSPDRTAECLRAMTGVVSEAEITVKCRLGVDEQEPERTLPEFVEAISRAGVRRLIIHARMAYLDGLNPKQNRTVPPLNYDLVFRIKRAFPELTICINGGIGSLAEAERMRASGMDGVMIGRAAYRSPADLLMRVDRDVFGIPGGTTLNRVLMEMQSYILAHVEAGGRITAVTRHMLGLFTGRPGARHWRRMLSDPALNTSHGPGILEVAFSMAGGAHSVS
ncbi:MAG: tRNA dihydrouridine(20/20a) synthase DusA [Rhodobacteraceae bacterium]|nr:tRNA dihydrouridine(20/20a) synthase DusA [Paracoccaceae bacterium]